MRKKVIIWIIIALLTIICTIPFEDKISFGYSSRSEWWTHFTWVFFHVNYFHLAINTIGLYDVLKCENRKLKLVTVAYVCCILASYISCVEMPTIGLSGLVFAALAIRVSKTPTIRLLSASAFGIGISFIMNGVNPFAHLYSYILGFAYGFILNLIDRYKYDIRGYNIRK